MARFFRRRRRYYGRRYKARRTRLLIRRALIRKKIKRFVNKMGYPSYVKMIGMTESKKLLLRKTLMLNAPFSTDNNKTNAFQIVLNPLECPNISKIFKSLNFSVIIDKDGKKEKQDRVFTRVFKYDYLRIKNIFISIKPAQNVSTNSGTATDKGNDFYTSDGDSPISNVYAYFTYRYPMLSPDDINDTIENMYGTNPDIERIIQEGKLKNTYSWPSNKPMTISINKLMYRVNTEPFKLCSNNPFDLQFLNKICKNEAGIYDPFKYNEDLDDGDDSEGNNDGGNNDGGQTPNHNANYNDDPYGNVVVPDLQTFDYNLFFGRLVIVSPKHLRFTAEICYDCVLLR